MSSLSWCYGGFATKVAIVTGGASGIGAACPATLAREGAKVVVTDVEDAGGQGVVDKIGSVGGEAIFLHHDVTLEESWPAIIEATERPFGRLDVMVANAGIGIPCAGLSRCRWLTGGDKPR
jgi:NAD(P)-dependent dehydrogenase (short-subunit alcohol dehydrogenase family)